MVEPNPHVLSTWTGPIQLACSFHETPVLGEGHEPRTDRGHRLKGFLPDLRVVFVVATCS